MRDYRVSWRTIELSPCKIPFLKDIGVHRQNRAVDSLSGPWGGVSHSASGMNSPEYHHDVSLATAVSASRPQSPPWWRRCSANGAAGCLHRRAASGGFSLLSGRGQRAAT